MSSAKPAKRQKDSEALMNSKDYQYIMATSESDMGSSSSSSTSSPLIPKAPTMKPVRADNSIKAKDYSYIMDTSASEVSSSPSLRSLHESVGTAALPSKSCRRSPRRSASGSDKVLPKSEASRKLTMSSAKPAKRQKDSEALMNSKDYQYIMATSESDMGSSSSSSTSSPLIPKAPTMKPVRVYNSIKAKDYSYIMDTSASEVSSSPSLRSLHESVGTTALPSKSCRRSPRRSASGSDKVLHKSEASRKLTMSSAKPSKRQKDSEALMNSKDYQYIMATSESDMGSSTSSSTSSPLIPSAPTMKPVRVDNSIKAKDYSYIMDTSASEVSSSPFLRSLHESVGTTALPSRICRSNPRRSDNVSTEPPRKQHPGNLKKPDVRNNTSPTPASDKSSSPPLYPRSQTASSHSVWSSEILSSFSSSDSKSVFDPFAKDHLQPRPSPREPSVVAQFPVAETISELSLPNRSDESWFTGSKESNNCHQEELHQRKLLLDQAWVRGDRKQSMADWLSSVHVWDDDVASNLGVESLLTRLKTRFQSTWWRLTRGRGTRVETIKKLSSVYGGGTCDEDEDKTPRREKLQKRMQKFISRVFICGEQSQA